MTMTSNFDSLLELEFPLSLNFCCHCHDDTMSFLTSALDCQGDVPRHPVSAVRNCVSFPYPLRVAIHQSMPAYVSQTTLALCMYIRYTGCDKQTFTCCGFGQGGVLRIPDDRALKVVDWKSEHKS